MRVCKLLKALTFNRAESSPVYGVLATRAIVFFSVQTWVCIKHACPPFKLRILATLLDTFVLLLSDVVDKRATSVEAS